MQNTSAGVTAFETRGCGEQAARPIDSENTALRSVFAGGRGHGCGRHMAALLADTACNLGRCVHQVPASFRFRMQ
ncbi:hypothetical protein, partial [Xanthomonas vesicatoria]|uniref:hypothetical protein n=1 Tax=Xanthomonas vesicatoria TaxID=56460 RepID=UPI0019D0DC35